MDRADTMVNALDPAQQNAATGTAGIQLVLAGPGAGKTTTLAGRFVHLVRHGVDRRRILALTFTKKAADEMKSRIAAALDLPPAADLNVATFHGFAFRLLRRNPQLAGLSERFPVWDTLQQRHIFNSRRMWWNEETDITGYYFRHEGTHARCGGLCRRDWGRMTRCSAAPRNTSESMSAPCA